MVRPPVANCCSSCGSSDPGEPPDPPGDIAVNDERLASAGRSGKLDDVRWDNTDNMFGVEGECFEVEGGVEVTVEMGVEPVFAIIKACLSIMDSSVGVLPGDISMSSACWESVNKNNSHHQLVVQYICL